MHEVRSRPQLAAEATQQAIVEAAARLFLRDGYVETPVGRVAAEAGVALQTIYNSVGPKRELLSRVVDFTAAGERASTPVPQFMRETAEAEPDSVRVIAQLVAFWRAALERTAPVVRMIRQAAATDPKAAEHERVRAAQQLRDYGQAARILAERGALRRGLSVDHAAAAIFAIGHPETHRALVLDGGWPEERWAAWAQSALEAALLEP